MKAGFNYLLITCHSKGEANPFQETESGGRPSLEPLWIYQIASTAMKSPVFF